ncbi:unnamed protein product [Leptosia nina]|uniref:Uncharacterized protein n=1 Tax=Leptosia nina TaxID=320188 RepID=A0AAV1IUZ6_9NEOP
MAGLPPRRLVWKMTIESRTTERQSTSVLDALEEGVNLKGYIVCSLIDNFEWMSGYSECFGLYQVNFESPEKTRTPKKSAFIYKEIIKSRIINPNYEPPSRTMWIDEGH